MGRFGSNAGQYSRNALPGQVGVSDPFSQQNTVLKHEYRHQHRMFRIRRLVPRLVAWLSWIGALWDTTGRKQAGFRVTNEAARPHMHFSF